MGRAVPHRRNRPATPRREPGLHFRRPPAPPDGFAKPAISEIFARLPCGEKTLGRPRRNQQDARLPAARRRGMLGAWPSHFPCSLPW